MPFHDWNEADLQKVNAKQPKLTQHMKQSGAKKMHAICICLDDWADRPDIMHKAGSLMTSLMVKGRHAGINTWLCSQAYKAICPVGRANYRFLVCWKLNNAKEREALIESFSAIAPPKLLREMYDTATAGKHDFWYIDLVDDDGVAFYKGFYDKFVL